jgi:signal transduction histidine kinase
MESILNVDDYGPGRYARTRVLQQAGFVVREAATGQQAIDIAAEYATPLILLDVNLPDMSGFEVCRKLRQNPKTVGATILHISASNIQSHHQVEGLDCGADSYLVEPLDPNVLIATVRAFLRARQAEKALRRSNEELEAFGYRVAHDLSEPLRTVVAHSEMLEHKLGPQLDAGSTQSLHFVIAAAKRMQSFIDGLLRYAQMAHPGKNLETFDSETLLAQIASNLEVAVRSSGARITHDPLPAVVADRGLEEVLQNLIGNAIKYRRDGVPPEVHVSAQSDGDFWLFSVRDNGIGIEEQYHDDIFQIFRRLHGQEVAGNGIGLALSKKIVEAHGGTIWVKSEPGVGSTFYFTLLKEPASEALRAMDLSMPGHA